MGKIFKKIKKDNDCFYITVDELNELKERGLELKGLIENALKDKKYELAKDYSVELSSIIKKVRKYKKYAR